VYLAVEHGPHDEFKGKLEPQSESVSNWNRVTPPQWKNLAWQQKP